MKRTFILAILTMFLLSAQARRLSFDRGWTFCLCRDAAELAGVLRSVGVEDNPLTDAGIMVVKNKVANETEPEAAVVTDEMGGKSNKTTV